MSQVKNKRWIYRHLTTCIDNGSCDVYRKLICRVHFDSVREKTGWIHLYITIIILIFSNATTKVRKLFTDRHLQCKLAINQWNLLSLVFRIVKYWYCLFFKNGLKHCHFIGALGWFSDSWRERLCRVVRPCKKLFPGLINDITCYYCLWKTRLFKCFLMENTNVL